MGRLLLIKHSHPSIDASVPWHEWSLSEEGRRRCEPLADIVAKYRPSIIFSSTERKAVETAEIVAARLSLPVSQVHDLRENDRTGLGIIPRDELARLFADFFARPDDMVMGAETAQAALQRFSSAVQEIVSSHDVGDIAVVAHGTVITLFVAAHNDIDPFAFWQQLGLPSVVVLSLPGYGLVDVASEIS